MKMPASMSKEKIVPIASIEVIFLENRKRKNFFFPLLFQNIFFKLQLSMKNHMVRKDKAQALQLQYPQKDSSWLKNFIQIIIEEKKASWTN
jgi:hypothetical protein